MNATTNEIATLFWSQFWQVSALIVLATLLGATILKRRPHLMHVIWVLVFIKCLTVPIWSSPVGLFSRLQQTSESASEETLIIAALGSQNTRAAAEFFADSNPSVADVALKNWSLDQHTLLRLAAGCWLLIATLLAALTVYRWQRVARRMKSEQLSREVDEIETALQERVQQLRQQLQIRRMARLHVSDANVGPMVFGFLRPVIILPRAMVRMKSVAELEPALMHELLHIRRGDSLFSLLQVVAQIVWWFHPLVWWANRRANEVCERCCDEEAVANLRCRPVDYARCLVDALEIRAQVETMAAAPGIRSVDITSLRLQHILRNAHHFRARTPRWYPVLAVLLAFVLLPGAAHVVSDDRSPEYLLLDSELAFQPRVNSPDWEDAVARYRNLTKENSNDARAWFMLGYTLHMNGRLDEAIAAHQRAAEFPTVRRTALYNLGCAYALQGQPVAALNALQQAIDAGFISRTPIENDPDLASLKSLPKFEQVARAARPPKDEDVYRQLDFWIGKWNVFDADGQKVGSNVITRDADGFLIIERWKELSGATGTSINFYDPAKKKWKQTSVDATGRVIQYQGMIRESGLAFEGHGTGPDGRIVRSRVFYRRNGDGSVRQLVEQSWDDGKTWQTSFEGLYVRQNEPSRGTRTIEATVTAG